METLSYLEVFYLLLVLCILAGGVIAIVVVTTVYFLDRRLRFCPECQNRGTGYIINTETYESKPHIDYRGNKPVRIQEIRTVDRYECERCGHQWNRTMHRTDRTPHTPTPESQ